MNSLSQYLGGKVKKLTTEGPASKSLSCVLPAASGEDLATHGGWADSFEPFNFTPELALAQVGLMGPGCGDLWVAWAALGGNGYKKSQRRKNEDKKKLTFLEAELEQTMVRKAGQESDGVSVTQQGRTKSAPASSAFLVLFSPCSGLGLCWHLPFPAVGGGLGSFWEDLRVTQQGEGGWWWAVDDKGEVEGGRAGILEAGLPQGGPCWGGPTWEGQGGPRLEAQ